MTPLLSVTLTSSAMSPRPTEGLCFFFREAPDLQMLRDGDTVWIISPGRDATLTPWTNVRHAIVAYVPTPGVACETPAPSVPADTPPDLLSEDRPLALTPDPAHAVRRPRGRPRTI